jgi:succinate dehydrogenase / fumarate reductase cytochrome b subunit
MYTMALSILHRLTGCAAAVGFLLFVWWLMALASGPAAYADTMNVLGSPVAKLLLVGFVFSFIYHFCNGIRHLLWDIGVGLERRAARRSATAVIAVSVAGAGVLAWLLGLCAGFA